MKHHVPGVISKIHVREPDVPAQFCIGVRAVAVGIFPCPGIGPLRRLSYGSLSIHPRIDQGHGPFIRLRLLIHHIENPFRPGQRHDDGIGLLGYLGKGLVKAFGELQVGRDLAQGQAGQAAQGEHASRNGGQHELQVPYVGNDRHNHIGVFVGIERALTQLVVQRVEFFHGLGLVVKYLDYLLSPQALLNIPGHTADCQLLGHKVFAAPSCQRPADEQHKQDHGRCQDGQRDTDAYHHRRYCQDGYEG